MPYLSFKSCTLLFPSIFVFWCGVWSLWADGYLLCFLFCLISTLSDLSTLLPILYTYTSLNCKLCIFQYLFLFIYFWSIWVKGCLFFLFRLISTPSDQFKPFLSVLQLYTHIFWGSIWVMGICYCPCFAWFWLWFLWLLQLIKEKKNIYIYIYIFIFVLNWPK